MPVVIEVLPENGEYTFPVLAEPWWPPTLNLVLVALFGLTVFGAPFLAGLLRSPSGGAIAATWLLGFLALVAMKSEVMFYPSSVGLPGTIGFPFLVVWLIGCGLGASGASYGLGWLAATGGKQVGPCSDGVCHANRGCWIQAALFIAPVLVGLSLLVAIAANCIEGHEREDRFVSEQAYATMLEEIMRDPRTVLPDDPAVVEDLLSDGSDPYFRGQIESFESFETAPGGAGYEFTVEGSPRRIRGEPGRVWIEVNPGAGP